MKEEGQELKGVPSRSRLRPQRSVSGTDRLLHPYEQVNTTEDISPTQGPGTQSEGSTMRKLNRRHSRKNTREYLPYQPGFEPAATCGKDIFLSTVYMLKDLLKQERLLCRCFSQTPDPIFKALTEVLEKLEQAVDKQSVAVDQELIPVEKVKSLENQWIKMSPLESNHLRSILFVVLTQLQRSVSTTWPPEDGPSLQPQVREIVQKLLVFVSTTRSDLDSILNLQRDVSNIIWRLNHVHKVGKRVPVDSDLLVCLDRLSLDLMQLNNALLSSAVEQRVVLWPSLEYYAQGRGSNLVRHRRGTSEVGSQTSTIISRMSSVAVEVAPNNEDIYGPFLRGYVEEFKGIKVLQLALNEMLLEEQEWSEVNGLDGPCFGVTDELMAGREAGDAVLDGQPVSGDVRGTGGEPIGRIIKEALKTTSSLLALGTNQDDVLQEVDESCCMVRIEYLAEEKFRGVVDLGIVHAINELISLNHTLSRLRWSLVKLAEDSFPVSEGIYGVDRDEISGPYASYFPYEDSYILKDEVIIQIGGGLPSKGVAIRTFGDGDVRIAAAEVRHRDGDKMAMFLQKFRRQITVVSDLVRLRDDEALRLGNAVVRLDKLMDVALCQSRNRREFWSIVLEDRVQEFEKKLRDAYDPAATWKRPLPIDCLLFDGERDALRELAMSPNESVLENLDRVTQTIRGNREGETWGRRYVRGFPRPPEPGKVTTLDEATLTLKKSNLPMDKLHAGIKDVGLLVIFPVLYLADICSDCYLAFHHFSETNYLYFALTILFVLGPMVAEIISKFVVKLKGSEEDLPWKKVFSIEILRLLPRAYRSLRHALDSRKEFDRDLSAFYSELNRLRGIRADGGMSGVPSRNSLRRPNAPWNPRSESSLIQALSYTMMVTNEKQLFHWKMVDTLNESAPQLLLQLIIVNTQLVKNEAVGHWSILGILMSLACFSWTLHLCHYYMHYDGLKNNFKLSDRISDFVAHFLIVCGRFMAISCVAALYPIYFFAVSFLYLTARFIYLYHYSSSRWAYRLITRNYLTVLWPVHRLFITPYILRIWRCDALDDVIYHVETFVLALSWAYLLDGNHPLGHLRWTITASIMILNFVLLPLILKYNNNRHDPSRFCKEDDPFWIGKYLGKKLELGGYSVRVR